MASILELSENYVTRPCIFPASALPPGKLKVLPVLKDNRVIAARSHNERSSITGSIHRVKYFLTWWFSWTISKVDSIHVNLFFLISLDMINVTIYCLKLWECSIWHKAYGWDEAWEILLLVSLSLGKKLGHISHSAYHLGRFSEFLKGCGSVQQLCKTPRLAS